jgi:hypothetical protein
MFQRPDDFQALHFRERQDRWRPLNERAGLVTMARLQMIRQIVERDAVVACDDHRALNGMFELAYVAAPIAGEQPLFDSIVEREAAVTVLYGKAVKKRFGQQWRRSTGNRD